MAERASVSSLATVPTKDVLRDLPQSTERSFFSKIAGIIPRMLFRLISFATISVPLFFYRVLTWSFTVHLNFSSLVVLVVIIATGVYLVVRYRFLTKYSRLKPIAPPKVVSSFDLHPDTGEDSEFSETGYKNYPDEFLSAFLSSIKIFGYLEQPVFHELARHLQTKKLLAGDTLFRNPEQERSFYIVVDGHVQMFVKPENAHEDSESSDEDELWGYDANRKDRFRDYSVINEVGPGGTLSSLFTILSIFKESFNKAEAKEKQRQKSIKSQLSRMAPMSNDLSFDMSREGSVDEWREVFPNLEKMDQHPGYYARPNSDNLRYRNRSTTVHPTVPSNMSEMDDPVTSESSELRDGGDLPSSKFTASLSPSSSYSRLRPELRASRSYRSVHPNIIARATVDTTLAVIPEEAFHKLTLKFPKAAAHIVQVIVTRFQRVTLSTSHKYLGLTKELLRLQKLVHESANLQQLPPEFYETGGMDRLRSKFKNEQASEEEENTTGPSEINRSESSGIIRAIGIIDLPGTPGLHMNPDAQGPMLSSSPNGTKQNRPLRRIGRREEYSVEDDENLRMAVRRCIADSLGVKLKPTINESDAKPFESSPRTTRRFPPDASDLSRSRYHYPMDLFSHTGTVDSNTSPSIDAFDSPYEDDADVRSTTSSVQSGSDIFGNTKYDPISVDDIQILYFPKDAVLVKEGAHSNGLFFVIDGLLEVSMTPTETADNIGNTDTPPLSRKSSHRDRRKSRVTHAGFTLSPSVSTSSSSANLVKLGDSAPANNSKTTSSKQDKVVASEAPAGRSNEKKSEKDDPERAKKPIFVIKPGGLAGYLDALTGYPSFVEIRAKTDTYVGYVSKKRLDHIIDKNPAVMFKLANQLVKHVSPLILHIDISLEWMQVNAGQIICKEGDPSESIYMVLHGRLRTIHEKKEGDIEILGEFGHGDSVGELEVLTGATTPSTLHAIRDTELARIPKTLFNALALRHPEITLQITRMVALRSLQLMSKRQPDKPNVLHVSPSSDASSIISSVSSFNTNKAPELYGRNNTNLKTIGILPVNSSVPVTEFAESLKYELLHSVDATCTLLNSATVTTIMGKYAFSRLGKLKLASWLAEQEEKYRIILYLADSGVTSQWTRTCIRQADCILLVGLGDGDPSVGEYERFLINMKTTARKELVLLHNERSCASGSTQNWLKNRLWIQAHHHIYMPMKQSATFTAPERFRPPWLAEQGRKVTAGSITMLTNVKDQIKGYYSAVPSFTRLLDNKKKTGASLSSPVRNDFARLARRICGKSVALVLGGGGARGCAHIGVIQAMEEAGIPIDIIGGTSIGSFVGGLYARNMDLVSVIARTKLFAGRVSSIWRQLMDLTYPVTAWFTGHEFNRAVWKCLGDSQIEDYWLPYYAVTTNITFSRMEVHTTGYAWRYIRASMSLSGYMPPICDNGNMLVDGGYMDNLPVSVAKNMGADIIIAVDVASQDDTSPVYYGDSISGWWALLHGFNPFRTYNVPSIADIQSRLAYVSSVSKLQDAKITDGTLYLKLPVQQWGTLEFTKFNDIFQTGYDVGREVVGRWRKAGYATGRIDNGNSDSALSGKEVKGTRGRRNSI